MVMLIATMLAGCATTASKHHNDPLREASKFYENHEYYQARRSVQKALEKNPKNPEAEKIMAQILDKEIERQKENLLPQAAEEMDLDTKSQEIKTWLERSQTLFSMKQYDLALFAAEKVFLYDYENTEASDLIDRIKGQALKEGKADTLFIHKMYKEEIADRLARYRNEGQEFLEEGRFGQARFTAEKVLLLEPEDPQALKLLQTVLTQEEKLRGESA